MHVLESSHNRWIVAPVFVGSPYLVNVSGDEVNGSSAGSAALKSQQLNVHELSHIGRDCQLTLKLPGTRLSQHCATMAY